jgi:UDP-N-acetylmuramate dehydrogenase
VDSVVALDRQSLEQKVFTREECEFAYRDSYFKSRAAGRFVILQVTYRLKPDAPPALRYAELRSGFGTEATPTLKEVRATVLELRAGKSMLLSDSDENGRSCGSFFVNAVVERSVFERLRAEFPGEVPHYAVSDDRVKVPSAWLIEQAGLNKGTRQGNVGLSSRHTLAIVSHPGATASEVVRFANGVRQRVEERFGIRLVPEPEFWGFSRMVDRLPLVAAASDS